jgi:hypothetical protein
VAEDPLFTLVTTTIAVPRLLEDYARDALEHGRRIEQFLVAGDRKSPPETRDFCASLESGTGIPCRFLGVEEQERLLERWPELARYLPWNSIQRRNVALLAAWEGDADVVVTIDDDNLLARPDYFGSHAHLGRELEVETVSSRTGWWNVCELLEEERGLPLFHRGFPLSQRRRAGPAGRSTARVRPVVNGGLWLGDPDVDALTRLDLEPAVARERETGPIALAPGTWSPFGSQNTALLREVLPAYFLLPYVGRYDDVWAGYVVRRLADELGDVVTYGAPYVRHERNEHDAWRDLDDERFGITHTDVFLDALGACAISADDYASAYAEVAEQLPGELARAGGRAAEFDRVCEGLRLWAGVFATV